MGQAKRGSIATASIAGVQAIATASLASLVTVGEVGNTRAGATSVDIRFDFAADANIFYPESTAHASVYSTNNANTDVDWYSFKGTAGANLWLDVDCGGGCGVSFDATLALFNSGGTLLAYSDDSALDPGSVNVFDSFVGTYTLPSSGTFYVAVSNFGRLPTSRNSCTSSSNLTRPDSAPSGGVALSGCPVDDSFSPAAGNYSTGDYTLHISTEPAAVPGPFDGGQIGDQPKYRWLELSATNPFSAELVAPADYPDGAGSCQMAVPNESTCSGLGLVRGCIFVGYNFPPAPPDTPTSGFECCGWQGKCELTCYNHSCTGTPDPCPLPCSDPDSNPLYCWNGNCSPQQACDDEETRLRGLGVPDCCFLSAGVEMLRWGSRANETPIHSDSDQMPNQCDNCPQVTNDTQTDTDGDKRGNACDSFPNHRYQCADTDADNCDDCKSGSYNPANDQNPCINPLPEPHAVSSLVAAAIAVGALARRRRR